MKQYNYILKSKKYFNDVFYLLEVGLAIAAGYHVARKARPLCICTRESPINYK
jgi:hypothetical protein